MSTGSPDPEAPTQPGPPAQAPPSAEVPIVRFACRVMLVANLLLAGFFCLFVVTWRDSMKDIFAGLGAQLPPMTILVLSIPASAYWANAGGLAAILVLLEAFSANRRTSLIANAVAIIFFVLVIILFEISLRFPLVAVLQRIHT